MVWSKVKKRGVRKEKGRGVREGGWVEVSKSERNAMGISTRPISYPTFPPLIHVTSHLSRALH